MTEPHESLLHRLMHWYQDSLDSGGYWLVAALMAIESTFVPIPSEGIIPFAAHYAQTSGKLTLAGVVRSWNFGFVAWRDDYVLGVARRGPAAGLEIRQILSHQRIQGGASGTLGQTVWGVWRFRGPLLPVVRHLIGIPMGIAKMNFLLYSIFTLVGSGIWCSVLAWVGVKAGQDTQLMAGDLHHIMFWMLGALAIIGALYFFFVHRHFAADDSAKKL